MFSFAAVSMLAVLSLPFTLLAQVPPLELSPDADLDVILNVIANGINAKNWWITIPAIVWLAVGVIRKYLTKFPAFAWFGSKMGGIVLALAIAIALALINLATAGTPIVASAVIAAVIKGVLMGLAGAGTHSVLKNGKEHFQPKPGPKNDLDAANIVAGG